MEKIMYCPIFEQGSRHETAVKNKRGLYNALCEYGPVLEFDYLANDRSTMYQGFVNRITSFEPTLMVTQLHGADILSPQEIRQLRAMRPDMKWISWSGDSWLHGLTAQPILDMAREFDLQLVAAPDVLPIYKDSGVKAAFWQIGYESPVGALPEMPHHDVVFLGNVITDKRRELFEFLRSLQGVDVGIYGDWKEANGENTYDFGAGEALYKNAKIAIADNVYPQQSNYVSNRPIQALIAGGAILLHQYVEKMDILLGIEDGIHYLRWRNFNELEIAIQNVLNGNIKNIQQIVKDGQQYGLEHHTYSNRVDQLFNELLPSRVKIIY